MTQAEWIELIGFVLTLGVIAICSGIYWLSKRGLDRVQNRAGGKLSKEDAILVSHFACVCLLSQLAVQLLIFSASQDLQT